MPLQDIVNSLFCFCGCDTILLPPAPTPSETDTENDNPPKKYQKRRKKSPKFGRLPRGAWQKEEKHGNKSNEKLKNYH